MGAGLSTGKMKRIQVLLSIPGFGLPRGLRPLLLCRVAAIDEVVGARDEAGPFRKQEDDQRGHLF